MSGKRLLDLAALFNASRGVAQKHVALRGRQLDVYNRTSTLAKTLQSQTDRVTETFKAATFLATRLNEIAPTWTSKFDVKQNAPIPRTEPATEAAEGSEPKQQKEALDQDHCYDRSDLNTVDDPALGANLKVNQEKADRYPLLDGTIPPADFALERRKRDHDVTTNPSLDELPKQPLKHTGFEPASSNASTIPFPSGRPGSAEVAKITQRQSEFQIPSRTAEVIGKRGSKTLGEGFDGESYYNKDVHLSPALSSLPRVKLPKHTSRAQGHRDLSARKINSESFYQATTSDVPLAMPPAPIPDKVPEDINTVIFLSPRIARLLGGRTQNDSLGQVGVMNAPIKWATPAPNKDHRGQIPQSEENQHPLSPKAQPASSKPSAAEVSFVSDVANATTGLPIEQEKEVFETATVSRPASRPYELRESKVPSSRLGRIWNYSGLAAGMFGGAITESLRRIGGGGGEGSYMLSEANMDRLVTKLSRMRGAALKIGQMLSFQDSKMLPPAIQEVLQRVQDRADYMPSSQRNKVLAQNLGADWRELFSSFEEKPLAAASIGQVHSAVLKSNGARVAVKVQYPGVADSIDSDLNNLAILLTASRLLPKGLFLDKTIENARTELAWECDYVREAECGRRFEELLAGDSDVFIVPKVYLEASGKQVLTMEFMDGVGVTRVQGFSQQQKDWIGTQILRLCLREITEFKFMQTDPNWTNFLYNAETSKLELLDFGASREYPEDFIKKYTQLLAAASRSDKETVRALSHDLGYFTGFESNAMLEAHVSSVLTLAEPFSEAAPEIYDFHGQTITDRVKGFIPVMVRERLAPPPEETYSLHRKLSGAFLLCARLGSRVRCRELFAMSMRAAGIV